MPPKRDVASGYSCVEDGTTAYVLPDGKRVVGAQAIRQVPEEVRNALVGRCRKQKLIPVGEAAAGASKQPELQRPRWQGAETGEGRVSPRRGREEARIGKARPPSLSPPRYEPQAASRVKAQAGAAVQPVLVGLPAYPPLPAAPRRKVPPPVPPGKTKAVQARNARLEKAAAIAGASKVAPPPAYTCETDKRRRTVWKKQGKVIKMKEVPEPIQNRIKCANV
jgi:hypothetical protein